MLILVLNEVDSLNNIRVVQCRRDTKLCRELLHIFLFCFILPPFSEFLEHRRFNQQWEQEWEEEKKTFIA